MRFNLSKCLSQSVTIDRNVVCLSATEASLLSIQVSALGVTGSQLFNSLHAHTNEESFSFLEVEIWVRRHQYHSCGSPYTAC